MTENTLYHVNNAGIAGKCRVKTGSCPFGEPGDPGANHYGTPALADAAYQKRMAGDVVKSHKSTKSSVVEPPLASIMDMDLFDQMMKERYLNSSVHPDDPNLVVLTYSHNAQILGRWNDVTKQARGLIIRKGDNGYRDAVIVERPWKKFFTLQQLTSTDDNAAWALGDEEDGDGDSTDSVDNLDFDAPAEVTDKLDGSLGILYRAPDGDVGVFNERQFRF